MTQPSKRRIPIWARWTLGSAVIIPVLLVVFVLVVIVSFSGGLANAFGDGTTERSPEVVKALTESQDRLRAMSATLASRDVSPAVKTTTALSKDESRSCFDGRHGWKMDDSFDLSCTVGVQQVFTMQRTAFRAQALTLGERLAADGWTTDRGPRAVITSEWDTGKPVTPAALSEMHFTRTGQPGISLAVAFTDPTDPFAPDACSTSSSNEDRGADHPNSAKVKVVQLIPAGQYAVCLGLSTTAFEK